MLSDVRGREEEKVKYFFWRILEDFGGKGCCCWDDGDDGVVAGGVYILLGEGGFLIFV